MPRVYSSEFKSTLAEVSAPEAPLVLLQIDHPELAQPVRVVNDTEDLTSNGNLYVAIPFRCTLPDDFENQLPKARLSVDNVGKDLMYWIETSGGGNGSLVTMSQVMRSRPDQIEWSITMNLFNVSCNMTEVSGELGYENLFAKKAIALQYRPNNSPGLF
jgi:hypothetical protein